MFNQFLIDNSWEFNIKKSVVINGKAQNDPDELKHNWSLIRKPIEPIEGIIIYGCKHVTILVED